MSEIQDITGMDVGKLTEKYCEGLVLVGRGWDAELQTIALWMLD